MLQKDGATPLYLQLKEEIQRHIEEGVYPEGTAIPSERELCQSYGVSRITVRQAIAQAVAEGILFTRQGKGTYVTKRKIDQSLERITGFDRTIAGHGLLPVTSLVEVRRATANDEAASGLGLDRGAPVVKMVLLGMADSEPMALYTSYFTPEVGMAVAEKAVELSRERKPFTSFDLYKLAGVVRPVRAKQAFEAALATGAVARLLKLRGPAAVFVVTSTVEASDGTPVEYRVVHYRSDRYKFSVTREVTD
ncbi:MAG: GntR family transcriptional regulator [Firmicutes bacterium]|nr:GntR family transcriptional regulator [Bacillota bacterium]